jgi:hypothetical protein
MFLSRAIERILIVAIAGVCIVLGWKLFDKNLDAAGQADLSSAGLRVTLKRIGPGVFFALFGASILIVSLSHPVTADLTDPVVQGALGQRNSKAPPIASGGELKREAKLSSLNETADRDQALRFAQALNATLSVATTDKHDMRIAAAALDDLARSAPVLRELRDRIVIDQIGSLDLNFWKDHARDFQRDRTTVSREDRGRLERIEPWLDESVTTNK